MKKKVTACAVALSLACQTAAVPLAMAQPAHEDADSKGDAEVRDEGASDDVLPLDQATESLDGLSETKGEASPVDAGAVASDDVRADEDEPAEGDDPDVFTTGAVEVRLLSLLPHLTRDDALRATLSNAEGVAARADFSPRAAGSADDSAWRDSTASMGSIEPGSYTLTLSGANRATYTQLIEVTAGNRVLLTVADSDMSGLFAGGSDATDAGLMAYGDFDADGSIGDADAQLLADALVAGSGEARFDLTADGALDLADVQAHAATVSRLNAGVLAASVRTVKDASQMDAAVSEGTSVVEGSSVESILSSDNAAATFAPANGAAISESNPISVELDVKEAVLAGVSVRPPAASENKPTSGVIEVELEDGSVVEYAFSATADASYARAANLAVVEADGTVVVDFGKQVAVKKIVIRVTGTSSGKLADIAQVEFLGDMAERVPAPTLSVPSALAPVAGDKKIALSWAPQVNVTGYEVEVSSAGKTQLIPCVLSELSIETFAGDELKNNVDYSLRVRSVNGDWRSAWSESVTARPVPASAPAAPDYVSVTGGYGEISVSWKEAEDADSYTLFYREKGSDAYESVSGIMETKKTVSGLKENTVYEVYVTAQNQIGTSPASLVHSASTLVNTVKVPWYGLINRTVQDSSLESHIVDVTTTSASDAGSSDPWAVVDGNYGTFYHSARDAQYAGPTVTFDREYTMDTLAFTTRLGKGYGSYAKVRITVENEAGEKTVYETSAGNVKVSSVSGAENSFIVEFPKSQVKKVTVHFSRYYRDPVTFSEVAFYAYDSLWDDTMALWEDDMHTVLRADVSAATIEALRERADTPDAACGELSPKRDLVLAELANAEAVLNAEGLSEPVAVDSSTVLSRDAHVGSGGLNAWQPLGVSAQAGEKLMVFVGGEGKKAGGDTELRLVATQHHAESNSLSKTVVETLKVGVNEATVPQMSNIDAERGGQLYIECKSASAPDYAVRVVGGVQTPVLDLHGVADEGERLSRAVAFVEELDAHVGALETTHADAGHDHDYDERNCIANEADIVLDYLMYSLPASQIQAGVGQGSVQERAATLLQSLDASDEMMLLFYQHKGLGSYGENASEYQAAYGNKNALPVTRQNIRYMRMFTGAFMYAGGKHIGIEWDQSTIPAAMPGITLDENGKYVEGWTFGWGIAHEIGHEINQGQYAIAEITNNYFSQLSASKDSNASARWDWSDLYEKVTSGTQGPSSNGAVQLGMYWQLHLAYDNAYNFTTYDDYADQFDNLFFARVDAYARNNAIAPAPGGVALSLSGADVDNALMRLSCASAQKNLLAFFEAWGMTPDEATRAYAAQFAEEARPVQYMSDDARVYQIEGGSSVADKVSVEAALTREDNSSEVKIALSGAANNDGMLGYEIKRNGAVVGFVNADAAEFVDVIATVNNRVFTYEVCGIDKHLNRTEAVTLAPVKVSHDGSMDKTAWTATTNMTAEGDASSGDEDSPCEPGASSAIDKAIDGKVDTVYTGQAASSDVSVTLSFNETLSVTGLKYRAPKDAKDAIGAYEVQTSVDGATWETVKSGTFDLDETGSATVYFNKEGDSWLYTYDAAYLRLVAKGARSASISEIDVLGQTGDDIDFIDGGIGLLANEIDLGSGAVVPAGSLVFTGTYKGNPAYNAVKLYDGAGNIIGGTQVLFAEVPEHGELGETADGRWLYYIEPEQMSELLPAGVPDVVRVELYRVDDAHTLQGERLVADALPQLVPERLPSLDISFDSSASAVKE